MERLEGICCHLKPTSFLTLHLPVLLPYSDMLVATWFFAVSTLPFVAYGTYAVAVDPTESIGYIYLVSSAIIFAALAIWLVAGPAS